MKKMKFLGYAAAFALAAWNFSACDNPHEEPDNGPSDARYRVSVNEASLTYNSVEVSVSCSGESAGTWYCFVTEDTESSIDQVIASQVASLNGNIQPVLKAGNASVTFSDLTKRTSYRVVVTGLSADGTTDGTPDEEEFVTPLPEGEWVKNPNWECSYKERTDMVLDEQLGTTMYADVLDFVVKGGTDFYLPAKVSLSDWEEVYGSDINTFAKSQIAVVKEEIAYRLQMGQATRWADYLSDASMSGSLGGILDSDEQWYAAMIGVDLDGNPTGLYAMSELFTPQEEEATAEYNQWLGTWQVTGPDEAGQGTLTQTIVITADENNYQYEVSGWQSNFDDIDFPPFHALYDKTAQTLSFMSEDAIWPVDLHDLNLDPDIQQYGKANIGFFGVYLNSSGNNNPVMGGTYPIGIATMTEPGKADVEGQTVEIGENYEEVQLIYMGWAADLLEKPGYVFTFDYRVPRFPYTMTKVSDAQQSVKVSSSAERRSGSVKISRASVISHPLPRFVIY